jgi:competence protein ComEC
MRDYIFFSILVGFLVGVFVRSFLGIGSVGIVFISVVAVATTLILLLRKKVTSVLICIPIGLVAFTLGILRFNMINTPVPLFLEQQVGQKVELVGIVSDDPDKRDKSTHIPVDVVDDNTHEYATVLISVDSYTLIHYGDEIRISGKLKKPENFTTSQDKEFDYISYLWKDDIRYTMSYAKTEILSSHYGSRIKEQLFIFKNAVLKKFSLIIPYPESGLMGGLVIGTKDFLSEQLRTEFISTGTIHIVALSGYNVSIVAEAIMKFFGALFSQLVSISLGIFAIIIFVIMTGASSTAVRAGIMGILALVARMTGRPYVAFRGLILAVFFMVLYNPRTLVFDVSFQLSFLATLGLIFVSPVVSKWLKRIHSNFLREMLSATISAQIAVLPFLVYKMGVLSLSSLPVNILILPFIPPAMLFGTIAGFISFVSHILAVPFGYISYGILHYIFTVVHIGASVSWSALTIKSFPLWATLLCYTGIIFLTWKKYPREED